jgi:3-isopropylmalate dehydratase small subunit
MSATEVLQSLSVALDRFGISYMLTGSFASSYYGASRSTQHIDFVIEALPEQLRAFVQQLRESNYYADVDAATQPYTTVTIQCDRTVHRLEG